MAITQEGTRAPPGDCKIITSKYNEHVNNACMLKMLVLSLMMNGAWLYRCATPFSFRCNCLRVISLANPRRSCSLNGYFDTTGSGSSLLLDSFCIEYIYNIWFSELCEVDVDKIFPVVGRERHFGFVLPHCILIKLTIFDMVNL